MSVARLPYLPDELAAGVDIRRYSGYFDAAQTGGLSIQRCEDCGHIQHPPREMCPECYSQQLGWLPVSGRGEVFTYTIARHPLPTLADYMPYNVVSVSLEEAPEIRIISNLVDVAPEEIYIGLPVIVSWQITSSGAPLPRFRRLEEESHD